VRREGGLERAQVLQLDRPIEAIEQPLSGARSTMTSIGAEASMSIAAVARVDTRAMQGTGLERDARPGTDRRSVW